MPQPVPNVTLNMGQSVNLSVQPYYQNMPGGTMPGPVSWSHNAANIGLNVNIMPNDQTCVLSVGQGGNGGSFSVTATSGALTANCIVFVNPPVADEIVIVVGAIN